jgi:RNA polymerase sigma-70 factor (ECF subfamily)
MERAVIYCVVPRELAPTLHDPLYRHFRGELDVEVVVERRARDRRTPAERRRASLAEPPIERRRIRSERGRRVADRRALHVSVEAPELPRKLRSFASQLLFTERLVPTTQELEDRDTAQLIARIQAGEMDLFTELYMRYFDRVYRYLAIALRDQHEAEDLAQTVFVKVFSAINRYERRGKQPFRAWLFRIVRNELISEVRKHHSVTTEDPEIIDGLRGEAEAEAAESGGGGVLDWITDRELGLFVERLPLAQRQVLVLRFMVGMSPDETATVLGRSATDVRTLQYRALEFLRARLQAVGREPRGNGYVSWRRPCRQAQVLRNRRFALLGN